MTKPKEGPARTARTEEKNRETVQAIVWTFNEIYAEMSWIEEVLHGLLDHVRVIKEKMRRVEEYRSKLEGNGQ